MLAPAALAHADESETAEGKAIVEEGLSCDGLADGQLEAVGEYLMELMHPGESHELTHATMGIKEGTDYHEKFHINLAQSMYCGEMPMAGMMGMMNWWNSNVPRYSWGGQMMGQQGYGAHAYWTLTTTLYVVLLIGIIGLVYFWFLKFWNGTRRK